MGYILNPMEVKGWVQEVRIWLNELDQRYQAVFFIIKEFSQNTELEGIAYNQMKKDFLEYHSLAVHGASEAKLSIERDLMVLEEVIGTEYLNEEVLEEQISRQEKTCRHYEDTLETLLYLSRNSFLAYYLEPLIKSNRSLLKHSEDILARLKEKLERLYEIDNNTRGLFNDASNWFSAVSAVINDRRANITGKGWRSDGSGKNLLLSSLEAKGVALAVFKDGSELSESSDANKAKIQKLKDMIEKTTGAMPRERNEWLENEVKAMMPYLSEEEKRTFEAMMRQHDLKYDNDGCGEILIGEGYWLKLYEDVSKSENSRSVNIPSSANPNKWAMKEDRSSINKYAPDGLVVNIGSNGELTDDNGRYWVAVGPNVMNPDHGMTEKVTAEEMKYGSEIDILIKDKAGNEYFIYAVVGDAKNHTYPNGIFQTGNAFPNGTDPHPNNADGSIIEFMGKGSIKGFGEYEIVKIIVYD